jgi:hypothetical protein
MAAESDTKYGQAKIHASEGEEYKNVLEKLVRVSSNPSIHVVLWSVHSVKDHW